MSAKRVDVLVAGAGPAGAVTAIDLSRRGCRVLLVEATGYGRRRIGEHLPPGAKPLLESLGAWERVVERCSQANLGIDFRWSSDELLRHDYFFHPQAAGRQLERARFDRALARCARDGGVELLERARVLGLERTRNDEWAVTVMQGRDRCLFRSRFVVDATGRQARIARALGVRRMRLDRQMGLAVWLSPDWRRFDGSALRRFLQIEAVEDGWWYFGALPDDKAVAVMITDADLIRSERRARPRWSTWWTTQAARVPRLRPLLAAAPGPSEYAACSADSSCLERSAGDGWVAVGDASAAYDPLSSQGIVRALESGREAAAAIGAAMEGDPAAPEAYSARARLAFTNYMRERAEVYSEVERWRNRPFWSRRRATPSEGRV